MNLLTGAVTADYEQKDEFTPFAALMFDVLPNTTLYASHADVFQPQNNLTATGSQLPPRSGSQLEIGAKVELLERALNLQLAVFRIRDRDRALQDTSPNAPPNTFVSAGEVESQGVDAEIAGRLSAGWEITAGYAYTETEYLRGTPAQNGTVFATFTPHHMGNVWTTYDFQGEGVLGNLVLGAGVRAVSSFYAQGAGLRLEADAYTVVSAQIGHDFGDRIRSTLTVNNLLDEKYYEKVSGVGRQDFYGEPLNVTLSMRAKF